MQGANKLYPGVAGELTNFERTVIIKVAPQIQKLCGILITTPVPNPPRKHTSKDVDKLINQIGLKISNYNYYKRLERNESQVTGLATIEFKDLKFI